VKSRVAALDTAGGIRLLWWLIGLLLLAGVGLFLAVGANRPADPSFANEQRQPIEGFETASFTIEHGAVVDPFCALLAETAKQLETGMMGQHDLHEYDAMVFRFPTTVDHTRVYFHNRKVPIALSVAWFDDSGRFVSTTDMEPCGDVDSCPKFTATANYRYAIEVPRGLLGRLGVGPGAILKVGAAC
jgi:uncharacterized membrane protein (UPF0127 family)